jgi:hypothetical protein
MITALHRLLRIGAAEHLTFKRYIISLHATRSLVLSKRASSLAVTITALLWSYAKLIASAICCIASAAAEVSYQRDL